MNLGYSVERPGRNSFIFRVKRPPPTAKPTGKVGGFAFAFSMSDCACCKECVGLKGLPCADPKKARPAFHSVGIDVFSTVAKFDLPLHPLKTPEEEQNWYSAVFIE